MKYIFIFILGLILGFGLGVNLSYKFVTNIGFDEVYNKFVNQVQSLLTGSKFNIEEQKKILLQTLEQQKEELKQQIKDQIKQSINQKIDELFKF